MTLGLLSLRQQQDVLHRLCHSPSRPMKGKRAMNENLTSTLNYRSHSAVDYLPPCSQGLAQDFTKPPYYRWNCFVNEVVLGHLFIACGRDWAPERIEGWNGTGALWRGPWMESWGV